MNFNRILQPLLIALLVIGVFASMAKNAYGFTFMAVACFGLAFLYVAQLVWKVIDDYSNINRKNLPTVVEPFLVAALLLLFSLRASYIYLANGEVIFLAICGLLVLVYLAIAVGIIRNTNKESIDLARNMAFFYTSLLCFLLALASRSISLLISTAFGTLGTLASLPFLWSVVQRRQFEFSGKSISLIQFVAAAKNKAGLVFIFFLSSALYTGLTYFSIIPEIENSERPKDYIELIRSAESGKEKPSDGKYRHQVYKESMDKFLKRHPAK